MQVMEYSHWDYNTDDEDGDDDEEAASDDDNMDLESIWCSLFFKEN